MIIREISNSIWRLGDTVQNLESPRSSRRVDSPGWAVSQKSRELFGPKKPLVKLQSTWFAELIFQCFEDVRKAKRIAKFVSLEPQHCQDIKGIVAPEIGPKSCRTFEKQAPGPYKI